MRRAKIALAAIAPALLAACSGCDQLKKSSNPLSPTIAGPIAGVGISTPIPMSPPSGLQIALDQQPINLVVQNAITNGVRPLSYVFEIATDPGFGGVVFSQAGVPPGANGQTSLRLPQTLPAERTYYWKALAQDGANTGGFSAPVNFQVYTPVVIQPPSPIAPDDGAKTSARPTMTVANVARSGPAGTIFYIFEVATDPSMANRSAAQVAEGSGMTSYTPQDALPYATQFYWRARALDGPHTGQFSPIRSFVTPVAPPTAPPPPPSNGPQAGDMLNFSQAIILNSPRDLASWPITTSITDLEIRPTGIHVEFSKADGPGRWPDVIPPGFDGPIQYTLGMVLTINGQLYASAPIQMWNGRDEGGGPPSQYALNWFYDPARWAPMTYHQPAVGESIGFFVMGGDGRNNTGGTVSPVKERSGVVVVTMPTDAGAIFRFTALKKRLR